jgi:hypothetical protein
MSESTTDTKINTTNGGGNRTGGGRTTGHRPPNHGGIPTPQKKQGLVPALGEHIFDHNVPNAAAQMLTTWEKIVEYVSSTYSNDISTELDTRKTLVLPPPEHSKEIQEEHKEIEKLRKTQLGRTMAGLVTDLTAHKAVAGYSARVAVDMENEIETLKFLIKKKTQPITLEGDAKDAWDTQRKQEPQQTCAGAHQTLRPMLWPDSWTMHSDPHLEDGAPCIVVHYNCIRRSSPPV